MSLADSTAPSLSSMHVAFLQSILEATNDDTPRLIYADWLDEHGEGERAEFIRVQCELVQKFPRWEGMPADDSLMASGEYADLRRRERELMKAKTPHGATNADRWFCEAVSSAISPYNSSWLDTFQRGFVSAIECTAADFLTHADTLRRATPLRKVRITPEGIDPAGYILGEFEFYRLAPDRPLYSKRFPGIEFELPS